MEIEKKFLLTCVDSALLSEADAVLVRQGYLELPTGEMRVRQKGAAFFLTIKGDGALSRDEWETEIPEWVFQQIWPATADRRVEKTRYTLTSALGILELDIYEGRLVGLTTLECEFPDEASASAFALPAWAREAQDVTNDPRYKNKVLAVHGLPPD